MKVSSVEGRSASRRTQINGRARTELEKAILADIHAIGEPLMAHVVAGTEEYRRMESRYNELAGRLARARTEWPDAFGSALAETHPVVSRVILTITDTKAM